MNRIIPNFRFRLTPTVSRPYCPTLGGMKKMGRNEETDRTSLDLIDTLPFAPPGEVGLSAEVIDRIGTTVQQFVDDEQIAGAATIVARRGKVVHLEAYGMMDREAKKPMQKDTIFRIYSMSKSFAAVGAMMLVEEGKVQLDVPASTYMPEFKGMKVAVDPDADELTLVDPKREMTVRDLFRHSSGLPGAALYMARETKLGELYREAGLHQLETCNLQDMVTILGSVPLLYHPGAKWIYSIAADVLGRLIEVVSGQYFDEFLSDRIFGPLGMEDTDFYVPPDKVDRFAAMYGPDPSGGLRRVVAPHGGTQSKSENSILRRPKLLSAGGGLLSTAADFARYCLMLAGRGELEGIRLLKAETVELMIRNQLPESLIPIDKMPRERYGGLGFGLGFSVRVHKTDWVPASEIGEYGWIGGASTEFWISPRDDLTLITLSHQLPFSQLSFRLKSIVYDAIVD